MTPADVRAAVSSYLPNGPAHDLWDDIGPFVRDAVVHGGCTSISGVYVALRAASSFAVWLTEQGLPLDRERVFDEATVERFVAVGLTHLYPNSRATYRSTLRRIGRFWTQRAQWSPQAATVGRKTLAPPYTADDIAWMWEIAESQKSLGRRRRATALLALAFGAGLRAHEVTAVHSTDVAFHEDGVFVDVVGTKARRVPVFRAAHEPLRWLCTEYDGRLLHADAGVARTAPTHLSQRIEVPPRGPAFDGPRLRTTWFVAMLSTGLRLSELYRYSGTVSTQALRDLLPYVPMRDEAAIYADIARWTW